MKMLKHMLVVVALLLTTAPCLHADGHAKHGHDPDARTEICASHACSCHACDSSAACTDDYDLQLQQSSTTAPAALFTTCTHLFTLTETKPLVTHLLLPADGVLASLQTVQLLI
ncbi:MAG: hypothetical protein KJN67_03170 [Pontiella sp.]|nr:hypothetical protein [Pontiella sp.]